MTFRTEVNTCCVIRKNGEFLGCLKFPKIKFDIYTVLLTGEQHCAYHTVNDIASLPRNAMLARCMP